MADWLLLQHGVFLYTTIFLMLLGGAVGLPIPEDVPLLLAGVLIHLGRLEPELIVPMCYVGVVVGDLIIFLVGRRFGASLFQKTWFKSRFPPSKVRRVRVNLSKRSLLMILVARHLFYLRTATFLICGAVRMSPLRFILADAIAALVSLPIMIGLGYLATEHIHALLDGVHKTKHLIAIGSILVVVGYLWYRQRRAEHQNDKESALSAPDDDTSLDVTADTGAKRL